MAPPRRRKVATTSVDLLVVGLGNPTPKYARTRHNAGVWVIEELVGRHGANLRRRSRRDVLRVAELSFEGVRVVAAVPLVFMNESGRAIAPLKRRYGIGDLSKLVIVHDELDLPVGRLKLKSGGGTAGHNGLESIRSHLRTTSFTRLRVGIGKPSFKPRGGDYVLKRPGAAERATLSEVTERAADAIECLATAGLDRAMNRFNGYVASGAS